MVQTNRYKWTNVYCIQIEHFICKTSELIRFKAPFTQCHYDCDCDTFVSQT